MKDFFISNISLFAQVFGFIAMALNILCFQFRKHKTIMLCMTAGSVFWVLHYLLLGLYPAAAINIMNMLRNYIYGLREKKNINSKLIPAAFVIIAAISVFSTWKNMWDILPLAASVTATIANWQTQTKKLKLLSIPRYSLWAAYDIAGKAWAGLANDIFTIGSIAISLIIQQISEKKSLQDK